MCSYNPGTVPVAQGWGDCLGFIYFLLVLKGQSGIAGIGDKLSFNMCYLGSDFRRAIGEIFLIVWGTWVIEEHALEEPCAMWVKCSTDWLGADVHPLSGVYLEPAAFYVWESA